MANEQRPPLLRDTRERAIARLSDLFARDELELEDFERKLSSVHRAATEGEVAEVLAGLPAEASTAIVIEPERETKAAVRASSTAIVPASQVRQTETLVSMLGGSVRRGSWVPPRLLRVVAILGGSELDFRDARMPPGITDVSVFAMMGGVHIIVPPSLSVEVYGTGIMGGFEHMARLPPENDPERPVLRVHGLAFMGGVSVETRLPGESQRAARRRRRRERKEHRRRLR